MLVLVGVIIAVSIPGAVHAEADIVHPEAFGGGVGAAIQSARHAVESFRVRLAGSIKKEQERVRSKTNQSDSVLPIEDTKKPEEKGKPGVNIDVTVDTGIDMGEAQQAAQGTGSQIYVGILGVLFTIVNSVFMFYGLSVVIVFFILRKIFHRVSPHVQSWE